MNIRSAKFVKGLVEEDDCLENGIPQIAFIGRSNVGKSSLINSLTKQKGLAKTSSFPGRTQQINLFLINKSFYFVDLPGYGFARASWEGREKLVKLIYWYLLDSPYEQKYVVLILDAKVGPTKNDLEMLQYLREHQKKVIIVANKVDKIKKSEYQKQLQKIHSIAGDYEVFPYSSEKNIGASPLLEKLLTGKK